jgi:hypothetical protein
MYHTPILVRNFMFSILVLFNFSAFSDPGADGSDLDGRPSPPPVGQVTSDSATWGRAPASQGRPPATPPESLAYWATHSHDRPRLVPPLEWGGRVRDALWDLRRRGSEGRPTRRRTSRTPPPPQE